METLLQFGIAVVLLIMGGLFGAWIQAKFARKIRMQEIIAEKKLQVYAEAYAKVKHIISVIAQSSSLVPAKELFQKNEEWFWKNRIYFPGEFPDYWLTGRNHVDVHVVTEQLTQRGESTEEQRKEYVRIKQQLPKELGKATEIIYKELNLKEIKPRQL